MVTADNSRFPITHVGKAVISPHCGDSQVHLQSVYYVLGMKKNLLSVSQLTKSGRYIVFGPKDVKIYDKLKIIGEPMLKGRHLESIHAMSAESAYVDKTCKNDIVDFRRACLGHVSYHRLRVMMKKSMLKGLPQLEV